MSGGRRDERRTLSYRWTRRTRSCVAKLLVLVVLSGCVAAGGADDGTVRVGCDGNGLAFDVTRIEARSGATVRITFVNDATAHEVYHNLVVVRPGTAARIARAGIVAGFERGWIPVDAAVLAKSRLLTPGERDEIVFPSPPPGDYPFLCTVPGHYPSMSGVLVVR